MKLVVGDDYDTDNRDPSCTELVLTNVRIDVNPIDLFNNMLENNFDPDTTEVFKKRFKKINALWKELKGLVEQG